MHTGPIPDSDGRFSEWKPLEHAKCPRIIEASKLPCDHPIEYRVWESNDGAYDDVQYRCIGGGHSWWVESADA